MSQISAIENDLALPRSQAYRDWLGVGASVLCAIHCAAMPFVIGFLPLLGLSFLADPAFHQWMVAICLALALLAFVPGWRRHHRLAPTGIGLAGLTLITVAAFAGPEECCPSCPPADETAVMTVAGPQGAAGTDSDGTPAAAPCEASCCGGPTEGAVVVTTTTEGDASCCSSTTTVVASTASTETACGAGCCPETDPTVMTADVGGFMDSEFMRLVWLWMTPIGGVILVVAHLTNHRLSAHCKAACCSPAAS